MLPPSTSRYSPHNSGTTMAAALFVQKQCSGHRIEPNPGTKRSAMVDLVVAVARVYLTEADKTKLSES
jgi:hypothetical protein